ncbi:MAG: ankyrin repeat domain-containing protein [Gammaproteobacteria bacterium]|nr:ankyrin repeat domain-containing protein [Gammaproteobacteria bacterium]
MDIENVFQAVRLNEIESFLSLIDSIHIDSTNEAGQNLLHEASAYKSLGCAKELLNRHINVNYKDKNGMVPLHYCAANNSYDVASEIINHGADLSAHDIHGNEPLWTAVFNARGRYDLVRLFIAKGANSGHKNHNEKSPLDFAKQINDIELVSILT